MNLRKLMAELLFSVGIGAVCGTIIVTAALTTPALGVVAAVAITMTGAGLILVAKQ